MIEHIIKYWVNWAMGLIALGMITLWRKMRKDRQDQDATQEAIQNGVKALLRDRIIQMYSICKSKGFCSIQEREALESLYSAYHDGLHGNGTITDIHDAMRRMPTEKERKEAQ